MSKSPSRSGPQGLSTCPFCREDITDTKLPLHIEQHCDAVKQERKERARVLGPGRTIERIQKKAKEEE